MPGADELGGLHGDPLEQLLRIELVDEQEGRFVQRAQLGVLALALLLVGLLRGDVDEEALGVHRPAGPVLRDRHLVVDPDCTAVLRDHPVLDREGLAALVRLLVRGNRRVAVVRVEDPDEELGVAHALERRVADEVLDLGAHVDARAGLVQARDVHDEGQLLDEAAVVAFRLAHPHLGLVALVQGLRERGGVLLQPLVAVVEGPGDLAEDREEGGVEEEQRQAERDRDRRHRLLDVGGDRRVGLVDLEHACRLVRALREDRDVGLEGLRVVSSARLLVEGRDFLDRLACQGLLQLGRILGALPDQAVVGRVRDHTLGAPELHAEEVSDKLPLEDGVELGTPCRRHGAGEIGVGQDGRKPGGDLGRVGGDLVASALLRLAPDDPEDRNPGEREGDGAVDGEPQDQPRRLSRRRRSRNGHVTRYRCRETP